MRELAVSVWSLVHGLASLALDAPFDEGEPRIAGEDRPEAHRAITWRAVARLLDGDRPTGWAAR